MASAIQRPLQRALTLIGVGLIGSSLSGCGTAWKQRIGLDQAPASDPLPGAIADLR